MQPKLYFFTLFRPLYIVPSPFVPSSFRPSSFSMSNEQSAIGNKHFAIIAVLSGFYRGFVAPYSYQTHIRLLSNSYRTHIEGKSKFSQDHKQ